MCTDMAGIATLGDSAVWIWGSVSVDLVGAVVLLVRFALCASQIGCDLRANTSSVSNLEVLDLGSHLHDSANDLVTNAEREWDVLAPATSDCVDVGCADTTSINGNIDIILFKLLERKLFF